MRPREAGPKLPKILREARSLVAQNFYRRDRRVMLGCSEKKRGTTGTKGWHPGPGQPSRVTALC